MASDVCIAFGKKIRRLRLERSWRQLDLAEQAGLNENYISDLELARKEACLITLFSISRAFNMKLSDLLKDVD